MVGFRFSGFEVDTELGELRRNGYRVPLQPQPFQILCLLLDANGAVVSREELIAALWQGRLLASADQSLNIAIRKLREALDDSSDQPRFIQTIPRLGHRFAGDFERLSPPPEPVHSPGDGQPATPPPGEGTPSAAPPTPSRGRRPIWVAAALLAALVLAVVWTKRGPTGGLGSRDIVLVARFEDSTGEKELEGAYEALFESELAASASLIIASPDRVSDTLRLMRRPTDGRRSEFAVALEVCRRDPGIRGVAGGQLRRLDGGYLLSVRMVDPLSGNTVAAASGKAATRAELVAVLRGLASTIGRRMGEDISSGHPVRPIEKVTTASLQAVRLFSEAQALGLEGKWNAAELLLRNAVRQDPEFPSGWILLAWAVRNQRPEAKDEIAPLLGRATRLAGMASENEALFIHGSGHMIRLEYREAVPYLEALFKADPQHPWAAGNLSLAYSRAGDFEKIPAFAKQLQAARPNDPTGYWLAADSGLCFTDSSTALIGQAADRAVDLVSQRGDERQILSAKLRSLLTHAAAEWSDGRIDSTRKMLDQARELLRAGPLGSHQLHVGAGYMALGMRREAESLFALEHSDTFRNNWIWWPALQQGDLPAVRSGIEILSQMPAHPLHAFVALRAGRPEIAANILRRQEQLAVTTTPFAVSAAKGELALQQGQLEEAIRILEPALADLGKRSLAEGIFTSQALSRALLRAHRGDEAIRVLEAETGRPRACGGFLRAAFWLPARLELLQLLEAQGRSQDAGAIRSELVQYTQLADPRYLVKQHVGAARPAAAVR